MKLEGILSIAGKPGLFKLISQAKSTIIVEHLEDKKRMPLYASHQVSALEDIGIYTQGDTVPLVDIFNSIYKKEGGKECISHKSGKQELFDWFSEVLPEFDNERVYQSDIKKIAQWYNLLLKNGQFSKNEEVIKESNK